MNRFANTVSYSFYIDVRLKKIADERNNLLDELSHVKLELEAVRAVSSNGIGNPLSESEEEIKEASKLLGDYKFKWQKAEQDVSTLQATVSYNKWTCNLCSDVTHYPTLNTLSGPST